MEKTFLQHIWDLYDQAERSVLGDPSDDIGNTIVRGRSHCISSLVEDAFANLLYQCVCELCPKLRIWIDTPVSVGKFDGRVKTIYPDILVTEALSDDNYMVHHIYELKANTGWMRKGAPKVISKMRDELDWMSMSAHTHHIVGMSGNVIFKTTNDTRYDLVILTSVNNKSGRAEEIVLQARQEPSGKIGGWLLCDQELSPKHAEHLGGTRDSIVPRPEFSVMLQDLKGHFGCSKNLSRCATR